MNRTSVVVVTYNSASVIERCLDACGDLPVIVVDNASRDTTCELVRRHSDVTLVSNVSNLGFAGAVNQAVTALSTELVLLLNPDVELQASIGELEAAGLEPGTGIVAGRLTDERGVTQSGFALRRFPTSATLVFEVLGINRMFPGNGLNRSYRCFDYDFSRGGETEQPPGAFMLFRREVWQRLGGFDTQFYPLWFEDVDFCKRVHDLGLKIRYVPEVTAVHQGGHSIAGLGWECREAYWYDSLLRYASKHFRPLAFRWVSAAVVLGSLFRTAIEVVARRSFRPMRVYAKIGRVAAVSTISGRVGTLKSTDFIEAVRNKSGKK